MVTVLRNIFSVIAGFVVGSGVNMALIVLGPLAIPPPAGVDVTNSQSLSASMHLFEAKHFVFPFLAHALGTLAGALTAFFVAASHRSVFAYAVGVLFLAGGIAATFMIGFGLALALGFAATAIGFDRERSFYPVVLIVIASYYILFAAMAGAVNALTAEAVPLRSSVSWQSWASSAVRGLLVGRSSANGETHVLGKIRIS